MTHKEAEQGLSRLKEEVKQTAFPELNQIVGQASKGLLPPRYLLPLTLPRAP